MGFDYRNAPEWAKERYASDAHFHDIVDWMAAEMHGGGMSVSDFKGANELAYCRYDRERREEATDDD